MRFKGILVVAAAAALALASPAQAGGFDSVDRSSGGSGPDGAWSSSAGVAADGAFTLAASVVNDEGATATSSRPSAYARAMASKSFSLPAGLYDVTATVTGLDADAASVDSAAGVVGLVLNMTCFQLCHPVGAQPMVYAVDSSTESTTVRGATLTTTVRFLLVEDGILTPTAVVEAAADGGTTISVDETGVGFGTGSASASATGVISALTVTAVQG